MTDCIPYPDGNQHAVGSPRWQRLCVAYAQSEVTASVCSLIWFRLRFDGWKLLSWFATCLHRRVNTNKRQQSLRVYMRRTSLLGHQCINGLPLWGGHRWLAIKGLPSWGGHRWSAIKGLPSWGGHHEAAIMKRPSWGGHHKAAIMRRPSWGGHHWSAIKGGPWWVNQHLSVIWYYHHGSAIMSRPSWVGHHVLAMLGRPSWKGHHGSIIIRSAIVVQPSLVSHKGMAIMVGHYARPSLVGHHGSPSWDGGWCSAALLVNSLNLYSEQYS